MKKNSTSRKTSSLSDLLAEREAIDKKIKQSKEGRLLLNSSSTSMDSHYEITVTRNGIDIHLVYIYSKSDRFGLNGTGVTKQEAVAMYVALCKERGVDPV